MPGSISNTHGHNTNAGHEVDFILISGRSNPELASEIAHSLAVPLADVEFTIFPNQETRVWIKDDLIDKNTYIIQSFSTPPDQMIMEFLLLVDAAKRSGARKVIGVVPWLGYSAQDKVFRNGEPLSSDLFARLLKTAGLDEIITLDLHSPLNKAYLENSGISVNHISALNVFIDALSGTIDSDWSVLCVDKGAEERSTSFAEALHLPLIKLKKCRDLSTGDVTFDDFTANLKDKIIISFDDFVSTGGTRIKASAILKGLGVKRYIDCITHGLLGNDAAAKIQASDIDELYITNSYPIPKEKRVPKMRVLSCAKVLADAIDCQTSEGR